MPFYKGEVSREKFPRRLEGAEMFAALSSPCHARVWGFLFSLDSFCLRDDAFGF